MTLLVGVVLEVERSSKSAYLVEVDQQTGSTSLVSRLVIATEGTNTLSPPLLTSSLASLDLVLAPRTSLTRLQSRVTDLPYAH